MISFACDSRTRRPFLTRFIRGRAKLRFLCFCCSSIWSLELWPSTWVRSDFEMECWKASWEIAQWRRWSYIFASWQRLYEIFVGFSVSMRVWYLPHLVGGFLLLFGVFSFFLKIECGGVGGGNSEVYSNLQNDLVKITFFDSVLLYSSTIGLNIQQNSKLEIIEKFHQKWSLNRCYYLKLPLASIFLKFQPPPPPPQKAMRDLESNWQ